MPVPTKKLKLKDFYKLNPALNVLLIECKISEDEDRLKNLRADLAIKGIPYFYDHEKVQKQIKRYRNSKINLFYIFW